MTSCCLLGVFWPKFIFWSCGQHRDGLAQLRCFGAALDGIVPSLSSVPGLGGVTWDGLAGLGHDEAYDLFTVHDQQLANNVYHVNRKNKQS